MSTFREENRYLIYNVNGFWLSMKSIELIEHRKWLVYFLRVWTKLPVICFPIYMGLDVPYLLSSDKPLIHKIAMGRKFVAFSSFFFKAVMFYWIRNDIEDLIDMWDSFFKEEFYPEEHKINRQHNTKQNKFIVITSLYLGVVAAFFYSGPSFFSKTKEFFHPSGIVYEHKSPDFELIVIFDLFCALFGITSPAFDSVLIVFLSNVKAKLKFLQETLTHMVNVFIIDDEGRLLVRRGEVDDDKPIESKNYIIYDDEALKLKGFKKAYYEEIDRDSEDFKREVIEMEKKLKIWILHHQQTIRFFDKVKAVYAPTAAFELGYIVVYTALTALHLVQVKPSLGFFGIIFVALSNLVSLFLWSKLGSEVSEIYPFDEPFGRAWFLFPKKIQLAFKFIIMRSKKSLTLYGVSLYGINLATFFMIMKMTYQFFAFMVQMTD